MTNDRTTYIVCLTGCLSIFGFIFSKVAGLGVVAIGCLAWCVIASVWYLISEMKKDWR